VNPPGSHDLGTALDHVSHRLASALAGRFSLATIRRYADDLVERWQARITNYLPIFVERTARERLGALAAGDGAPPDIRDVLFVSADGARAQMAATLLNVRGAGRVYGRWATSTPGAGIGPGVEAAMGEWGFDLSWEPPRRQLLKAAEAADTIITMGSADVCPVLPGKRYFDWGLPEQAHHSVEEARRLRDEIDARVRSLLAAEAASPAVRAG
jgi:arsenate reductase (thioredoxin)